MITKIFEARDHSKHPENYPFMIIMDGEVFKARGTITRMPVAKLTNLQIIGRMWWTHLELSLKYLTL